MRVYNRLLQQVPGEFSLPLGLESVSRDYSNRFWLAAEGAGIASICLLENYIKRAR